MDGMQGQNQASPELLRKALQAARSGKELTARDLFQQVVRIDPENEVAWVWLSGLLDPFEDKIVACERVLSINPHNDKVRKYLEELRREDLVLQSVKAAEIGARYYEALALSKNGRKEAALSLVRQILVEADRHEGVWLLFAELSQNVDDKVRAYRSALESNPTNNQVREKLLYYSHFQEDPLDLAAYYEEEGMLGEALELYREIAAKAPSPAEFDRIYKNIIRVEDLQLMKIQHVRPAFTIARLSAGIPLLYLLLVILQAGLNPFRHPRPHLWLGVPWVVLGSFLITMATVRSRHIFWEKLFGERGANVSRGSRVAVAAVGWFLVTLSFLILVVDSLNRLRFFDVPPPPWG